MISTDFYEGIRQAQPTDVNAIEALLKPLTSAGITKARTRDSLMRDISCFTVLEREAEVCLWLSATLLSNVVKHLGAGHGSQSIDVKSGSFTALLCKLLLVTQIAVFCVEPCVVYDSYYRARCPADVYFEPKTHIVCDQVSVTCKLCSVAKLTSQHVS